MKNKFIDLYEEGMKITKKRGGQKTCVNCKKFDYYYSEGDEILRHIANRSPNFCGTYLAGHCKNEENLDLSVPKYYNELLNLYWADKQKYNTLVNKILRKEKIEKILEKTNET